MNGPARKIHPLMRIPVPWLFVLVFLGGVGLQYLVALPRLSTGAPSLDLAAGAALTGAGALLAIWCLSLFHRVRTTTVPFGSASALVTSGPYRRSRNPMYWSLTLVYAGTACFQGRLWPVLLLPLMAVYLNFIVVPYEESRLRELFGDAYAGYCRRVRRWL